MRFLKIWILILTLLAGPTVYAADICQDVFRTRGPLLDGRYGNASQNDDYLWSHGLISPEGSQLCGPTCLYNALEKFHNVRGTKAPVRGAERIEDLVDHVFPNGDDVVRRGSNAFEMGNALVRGLLEEHISASVHLYSSDELHRDFDGPVTASTLRSSLRDDTIVIAAIGRYNVRNPRNAREEFRTSGHYVIIAGYHPEKPNLFYVIDPMSPDRFREIQIKPVDPPAFAAPTYAVYFTDGREGRDFVLIEKLVTARRRK